MLDADKEHDLFNDAQFEDKEFCFHINCLY